MEFELFIPVAQVFRNSHPFFAGRIPQVAEWGEVSRRHAEATMAWLDRELGGREFVAGPRYTIADITALCGIDFGRVSKIRIAPELANLSRWHAAVSARPSAKA
jgi:glutathione S-transferase